MCQIDQGAILGEVKLDGNGAQMRIRVDQRHRHPFRDQRGCQVDAEEGAPGRAGGSGDTQNTASAAAVNRDSGPTIDEMGPARSGPSQQRSHRPNRHRKLTPVANSSWRPCRDESRATPGRGRISPVQCLHR